MAEGQDQATYLHTLATFDGPLPYDGVRIAADPERDETYLVYQNLVHVFNASGMETFRFGQDLDLGQILDVAVDPGGDLFVLSFKDSRSMVTRCNFRGVPRGPLAFSGFPTGLEFRADRILLRNGLLYFPTLAKASVAVTDPAGNFRSHIDLLSQLEPDERKSAADAVGFTVDQEGNVFFTVPTLFRVFKRSPNGTVAAFGRSGSAPGQFGILAGIATDSEGHLLVADKLKCVIMVFDRDFKFVTEFGYRGAAPENLIVPDDVAVDRRDRVYVSQWRGRGVSVFALTLR